MAARGTSDPRARHPRARSGRLRIALLGAAAFGASFLVAVVALGAVAPPPSGLAARIAARAGARGPRGGAGRVGAHGLPGPAGPQGPPGISDQPVSINWQNDAWLGADSQTFVAPGIGSGDVTCSRDTQWVNFRPFDQGSDSEMWVAITRGDEVSVRAAGRRSQFYGPQFNIGLNAVNGTEAETDGSLVGIISSRGPFGSAGGPSAAPTTFRLSWHWSFGDGYGPRCYVAGTFISPRGLA